MRTVFRYGVALYVTMMLAGVLGLPNPASSEDVTPAQAPRARDRPAPEQWPGWMWMNRAQPPRAEPDPHCLGQ